MAQVAFTLSVIAILLSSYALVVFYRDLKSPRRTLVGFIPQRCRHKRMILMHGDSPRGWCACKDLSVECLKCHTRWTPLSSRSKIVVQQSVMVYNGATIDKEEC